MSMIATEFYLWRMGWNDFAVFVPIGFSMVLIQAILSFRDFSKNRNDAEPVIVSLSMAYFLVTTGLIAKRIADAMTERGLDQEEFAIIVISGAFVNGPLVFNMFVSAFGPVLIILRRMIQPAVSRNSQKPIA